ncbi:MAG: cytochrome c-type biogenesis protein CcmH, partial [Pseudomonadota bacterium]
MKGAVRGTLVALCLALSAPLPAGAVQPDEMLADPALEARAREIEAER